MRQITTSAQTQEHHNELISRRLKANKTVVASDISELIRHVRLSVCSCYVIIRCLFWLEAPRNRSAADFLLG